MNFLDRLAWATMTAIALALVLALVLIVAYLLIMAPLAVGAIVGLAGFCWWVAPWVERHI